VLHSPVTFRDIRWIDYPQIKVSPCTSSASWIHMQGRIFSVNQHGFVAKVGFDEECSELSRDQSVVEVGMHVLL